MITKITGTLLALGDDQATIGVEAFEYQVLIADFTRRQLQARVGEPVELHTIHYFEGNPQGRMQPRLVGFLNVVEREFFELFCSVDGVGVKKALRAMVRPVRDVAALIEQQDAKGLSTMPGIGPATADRVIAKLRRKMPKFMLLVAHDKAVESEVEPDLVQDTFAVLCSLGHHEAEARRLLDSALATKQRFKDVDAILQAIYQQKHGA